MAREAHFTPYHTGKAERLQEVRNLAAQDVSPDRIVERGRELGLTSEQIGRMYRLGRMELAERQVTK